MAALSGDGDSDSWQKANVARIFTEFQEQDPELLSVEWDLLSSSVLCDRPVYERFAHFLVHVYLIPSGSKNAGLPLGGQSVLNYLGSLINRAASKFQATGGPDIKEFFFCLEAKSGSASTKWLQKLKQKIVKLTFERAVRSMRLRTFAQWRKQYEAQDALADGAGPSTAPPQKKKPRK